MSESPALQGASAASEARVGSAPRRGITLAVLGALIVGSMILAACQPSGAVLQGRLSYTGVGPKAGVQVRVYSSVAETLVATTTTDAAGDWSFSSTALADGTYKIRFSDSAWWQNTTDWTTATAVPVAVGSTVTIDATITAARGSVAGTVTDGTAPLAGVTVTARNATTDGVTSTTTTQADGTYAFGALPAGDYRFEFSLTGYTTRYSDTATSRLAAPVITVTDGASITGIDTTLDHESSISGLVSDGTSPVAHTPVFVYDRTDGRWLTVAFTGEDGRFKVGGLNDGTYAVGFIDGSNGSLSIYGTSSADPAQGATVTVPTATDVDLGTLVWGQSVVVPTAPTSATAVAGDASAFVQWSWPASDGGGQITSYTATATPGGQSCTTDQMSCVVTGLTNDIPVTFTITAANSAGEGPASAATEPVTPVASTTSGLWAQQAHNVYDAPSQRGGAAFTGLTDGTAVLFGGASSRGSSTSFQDTWTFDGSTWTQRHPASSPPPRVSGTIAPLPDGHAILFGGMDLSGSTMLGDTWIWDGTTWTEQHPATAPSARMYVSMATLSNGDVLLQGGFDGSTMDDDTWIWDGTTWSEQAPTATPPARVLGALSPLPGGQALLFGGASLSDYSAMDDTWLWTGTTWVEQHPDAAPSGRAGASTAELSDGSVLLFGGADEFANQYFDDTWTWNGTTWVEQKVTHVPAARDLASMASLPGGAAVLFGGMDNASTLPNSTWTWNGTDWTVHQLTGWPTGTTTAATATLSFGNVLLFGGTSSGTYDTVYNDTWRWDGSVWTELQPVDVPPARAGAAMAARPNGYAVLFGGFSADTGSFDDTWVWNGDNWSELAVLTRPPAREFASMATLPDGDVVLFGGVDMETGTYLGDTWIFDGSAWTQVSTATAPSARSFASMTTTSDGHLLLFGGIARGTTDVVDGDTWSFDGTTWTELTPATAPPARFGAQAATLSDGRIVLFGGVNADLSASLGDLWTWDGTNWTQEPSSSAPPPRGLGAMAVGLDDRVVLVGGVDYSSQTVLDDFWIWSH